MTQLDPTRHRGRMRGCCIRNGISSIADGDGADVWESACDGYADERVVLWVREYAAYAAIDSATAASTTSSRTPMPNAQSTNAKTIQSAMSGLTIGVPRPRAVAVCPDVVLRVLVVREEATALDLSLASVEVPALRTA